MATSKIQTGIRFEEEILLKMTYIAKKNRRSLNNQLELNVAQDYKTDLDTLVKLFSQLVVQIKNELTEKSKHPEYFKPKTFHQWLDDNVSNGNERFEKLKEYNPAIYNQTKFGGTP